jgi:hypothetical protein
LLVLVGILAVVSFASVAGAHVARMTSAAATVASDGRVSVVVTLDVLSYTLNDTSERTGDDAMDALLDGPEAALRDALSSAQARLLRGTQLAGGGAVDSVRFPTVDDISAYLKTNPEPRLPVVMAATIEGHLPSSAANFSVRLPEVFGTVVMTVERPGDEAAAVATDPGQWSEPVPVRLAAVAAPVTQPVHGGGGGATGVASPAPRIPLLATLAEFIRLGFEHIVPEGLDHILFVLGLFLLSTQIRPLLAQVTAFTVAHSLTLGLSLYGVIHLPSSVVEPMIALSIAFVAVENVFTSKLNPWRPFVVFAFGLVHGLGFAGILHDLSLARSQFLPALVGFNLGVETGQLSVILAAFLVVGWFRSERWYRPAVAVPASLLIAATGLFWTVQRIVAP